ncbi:transcription regulator [Moniliophthora roreri MCA 2997]|uniref:Transcription regulator n=2 Tax=Moniliophthora roreri TaxID=221103 RepID=V2WNI4_MONRO|nr:transcription regulator [Moniliophthora roreri MCA 2997]KAI3610709.1 transcription regulator [Moniliophthora roreri]
MGLFNRKPQRESSGDDSTENKKEKGGWRRPANTAFKQQRLKAWQPILTPKTVLPTFFIIGIIFGPIGGLLIWGSSLVSEMTFDYTGCESLANGTIATLPSNKYSYRLSSDHSNAEIISSPSLQLIQDATNEDDKRCFLEFYVPADLKASVFMYYKLTNFYQNHRRYVKSLDSDQLRGKGGSPKDLDDSDCKPLGSIDGKAIYPCGLIANSMFNDTFAQPVLLNPADGTEPLQTYNFTDKGIAWPGEAKKYVADPVPNNGYSSYSEIVPPPNWAKRFPNNYTAETPPPRLKENEHFQNWMRTAGLPTFTKLYFRNDNETMSRGTYRIVIGLNFPVTSYKGTKSIVISTVSWVGGKNPFLGWAYVGAAGLFVLLAIAGLARHLIKPRRLGDMSLLSWNRT